MGPFRALALPYGLRSCWSSPIRGRTGTTGTFAVYHDRAHQPKQRERGLVERFTHLASVAIDHAGLFGALAESEERFRHAFEDSAVGMALTDLNGRFLKVDRALREMLRQPEAELLVTTIDQVLAPTAGGGDPAGLLREVATAARDSVHFEAAGRRSDGTVLRVAVAASAVRGAAGSPVHLSLNLQDVTQRHAAERERRGRREAEVARAVAEAASRAKSVFLTDLSHELRTPLQAITGFTELLGTLDLPVERRRAALSHIQGATAHIISLVDDVLDIAKIEAGALPLQITDVDLAAAIQDVLDLLSPLASERGITLRCERPAGTVRADERRLRQVLINLLTNAIRYNGPNGSVQITAGQHGRQTTIRVTDSGPGIPPGDARPTVRPIRPAWGGSQSRAGGGAWASPGPGPHRGDGRSATGGKPSAPGDHLRSGPVNDGTMTPAPGRPPGGTPPPGRPAAGWSRARRPG